MLGSSLEIVLGGLSVPAADNLGDAFDVLEELGLTL